MELLLHLVLVLHLLSWALVLGGAVVSMRQPRIPAGMLHGILTALVTGILLFLIGALGLDRDYDHVKLGVKFVVAVAVTALVLLAGWREERATRGLLGAVAGLTAVNVALAVIW